MLKLRDVIVFLAGAECFHTISHIILPYFITLPLDMGIMTLTPTLNIVVIMVNAAITIVLLWWASRQQ